MLTSWKKMLAGSLLLVGWIPMYAQETQTQQLTERVDTLEKKVRTHDIYLQKVFGQELPNSRNEVENRAYQGFVISSVKGIVLKIGGFAETDLIYDFNAVGDKNSFTTSSIIMNPTPGSGNVTTFSVRPSRLSFKGSNLDDNISALLEFDFAGSNGTTLPRLRHAFITYKNLGVGKFWSNFMDNDNNPDILDFEGPNGSLSVRVVQVRYTFKVGKTNKMAFSMEVPGAELTMPDSWSSKGLLPDLTASFEHRFWKETSHLRLAGLLHPVTYINSIGTEQTILGGGVSFSSCIQTGKLDNINLQVNAGSGYAKYNNDLGGLGYDAFQSQADTNKAVTVDQINFFLYYNHWWTPRLSSALGCSYVGLSNNRSVYDPDAIKSTSYASTNLIYYPNDNFKLGLEFLYGNRMNMDNRVQDAFRIQFTFFARI